jgi:hypothetical protein
MEKDHKLMTLPRGNYRAKVNLTTESYEVLCFGYVSGINTDIFTSFGLVSAFVLVRRKVVVKYYQGKSISPLPAHIINCCFLRIHENTYFEVIGRDLKPSSHNAAMFVAIDSCTFPKRSLTLFPSSNTIQKSLDSSSTESSSSNIPS